ncbi:MAG TPA: hypothetical protein VHA73_06635 [Acidimicrobiales bacterium]|jgi:hypothetical protein|nr:hypothetical protein [Acidimicrobiales bacterium]
MTDRRHDHPHGAPARRDALAVGPDADAGLVSLGLAPGQTVRFRPREGSRWLEATVVRRERDGSVGLRDERGRTRAIPVERLQVATRGPRGGRVWEPLSERAEREEQLAFRLPD